MRADKSKQRTQQRGVRMEKGKIEKKHGAGYRVADSHTNMSWSCGARAAAFNVNHQEGNDLRHGGYWIGLMVLVVQDSVETKRLSREK